MVLPRTAQPPSGARPILDRFWWRPTLASITGIEPGQVVRVVTTEPVGDNALTVYYKTSDGRLLERMLFRTDEATLALAEAGRPWTFDAPGAAFKLATEAYRITLAHLFD